MILYLARRKLYYGPEEWCALPWYVRESYIEGFYVEELLERPEPAALGDVSVPDDIRSLTASGAAHRAVSAPVIDIDALIGDLERRR
jgi:hypothetical protein